jgi:hypothetical protein
MADDVGQDDDFVEAQEGLPFALAPSLANNAVINYNTPQGSKQFKNATAPLPVQFDLAPENLKVFLAHLKLRADVAGWYHVLTVPENAQDNFNNLRYLPDAYGMVTLEQVQEHATTYIFTESRAAQENYQLYQCIMTSLTKTALARILLLETEYIMRVNTVTMPSGAALLRVVIRESIVDTNATLRHLREQLSKLDQYAIRVNGDIEKLNQYAQDVLNSLNARGATTQDMIPNLFKAYEAVPDKIFRAYILKKKDDYDEGTDMSSRHLMKLAENKYRMLVEDGQWQAPDEQSDRIIALEAQLQQLKKQKPAPKPGPKGKPGNNPRGKDKKKKNRPAWHFVPPKQGEPHTKTIKGDPKPWYWCPNHEAWGRHPATGPDGCKGKGHVPDKFKKGTNKPKATAKGANHRLTVSKALTAIMHADAEEDEESE